MQTQPSSPGFQMQVRSKDPRASLEKMRSKLSNSKSVPGARKKAANNKGFMNLVSAPAMPAFGSASNSGIGSQTQAMPWEQGGFENVIREAMSKGKSETLKVWVIVLSLLVTAAAANFFLVQNQSTVLEQFGVKEIQVPLAAPAGLSPSDKARFWAMAAWDTKALLARYPKTAGQIINATNAENHLRRLWKGLNPNLQKELQALHQSRKGGVFK